MFPLSSLIVLITSCGNLNTIVLSFVSKSFASPEGCPPTLPTSAISVLAVSTTGDAVSSSGITIESTSPNVSDVNLIS